MPSRPTQIPIIEVIDDEYRAYRGSLIKHDRRAHVWRRVLNAEAHLLCCIQAEPLDGQPARVTHYDVAIERAGHRRVMKNLPLEYYNSCVWLYDCYFEGTRRGRSDVLKAISSISGDVPTETLYTTRGWKEREDGQWMFVHGGGAINADGAVPGVRVQVDDDVKPYTLPDPVHDPDEIATDIAASLLILDLLPARIAASILGDDYRSVLGDTISSVSFVKPTGSFKSRARKALQQRTLFVPEDRGGISSAIVSEIDELDLVRDRLMATLISHHAKRMPAEHWIADRQAEFVAKLEVQTDDEALCANLVADLAVGWCAMLDMAVERKAIELTAARDIQDRAWGGLVEAYACNGMINP
jgi:hypothetical protein